MKAPIAMGAALLLASGGAAAGPGVVDADEAKVAHCTFLKDIEGRSVFGERLKEPAVKKAREDARGQAEKANREQNGFDRRLRSHGGIIQRPNAPENAR